MTPTLDRLVEFDERSRSFPVMATITPTKPRSYTWACPTTLDQGREGACVGFAWAHELIARPVQVAQDEAKARAIYNRARQLDQWPGDQHQGSSVIAGAKAVMELGHIGEYRWAFGVDDLAMAVSYKGPAILGLNWYEDMLRPDAEQFIRPTGDVVGQHAILCRGYSPRTRTFLLHNSWGPTWGRQGGCFIAHDDMARLLSEDGEACIPMGRRT